MDSVRNIRHLLLVATFVLLPVSLPASTSVSGTISVNTTWTLAGSPYIVTGDVNVSGNSAAFALTIDPGVVVKFASGTQLIAGYPGTQGTIQANGTAVAPILFTSNGSTTPGAWADLFFFKPGSAVSWATIEYAGWASQNRGGVSVEGTANTTFDHVTFRNNAFAGLSVANGATATLTNCTFTANSGPGLYSSGTGTLSLSATSFTDNTGYAVSVPSSVQLDELGGLTATGNGTNAIERRGGIIASSMTWRVSALPYAVTGTVSVSGSDPELLLTIEAGATLKFGSATQLIIGYPGTGKLRAVGTAAAPIVFTSNTTAVPGAWSDLFFFKPGSIVQYATIEYAGWPASSRGGVTVEGTASPSFDHVTFRNNAFAGLSIANSATTSVTSCTFAGNGGPGLYSYGTGAISLSGTSFTTNSGYAVSVPANVQLNGLSGLTASSNGSNAIELRGGTVAATMTWRAAALPYAMTGTILVSGTDPALTLTIEPGVVIKANTATQLVIGYPGPAGILSAVGTAAAPILFTSNASATAGSWADLLFLRPGSAVSYATIEYAGDISQSRGGVHMEGTASTNFDHVTFRNNAVAGLTVAGAATSTVLNCNFSGNAAGILKTSTNAVDARLCYWNSTDGPSGVGGSGQSVSSSVLFEPWLVEASSAPQYVTTATQRNRTFSPAFQTVSMIDFSTMLSGAWTETITNSSGTTVRTLAGSGATGTATWNGANELGALQPDGRYVYTLVSTTAQNEASARVSGYVFVDAARQMTASSGVTQYFSPNADGIQDTATISTLSNYDDTSWNINVRSPGGTVVRTLTSQERAPSVVWDGRDTASVISADGVYSIEASASSGITSATAASQPTTLDTTPPTASISAPTSSAVYSNVHQNGDVDVAVSGTAEDEANFDRWVVEYGAGASPTTWTGLASGTIAVHAAQLGVWHTAGLANGGYTLRVQTWDKAGNRSVGTVIPTVGNFNAISTAGNVYQLNAATGETISYASTIPFPLTEGLYLRNQAGQTVRTLFSGARGASTYTDTWNGKGDSGQYLPDGPYFFTASASDSIGSTLIDRSGQFLTLGASSNDDIQFSGFDPFNNQPLTFTYSWPTPGRTSINLSPNPEWALNGCNPPGFCIVNGLYEEAGPHTVTWAGVDATGTWRSDVRRMGVVTFHDQFSVNAVVVYGTKPSLTNLHVTPPIYGPAAGPQTIAFTLTTFQNQPVTVTSKFLNQDSLSTLRTVTATAVSPGNVSLTWDGRADNGAWVAPGLYTVTVTVTDSIGNVIQSQILTTIRY